MREVQRTRHLPRDAHGLGNRELPLRARSSPHYDRDLTIVLDIVREVRRGRAAGAEFAFDAVVFVESGSQASGWCGLVGVIRKGALRPAPRRARYRFAASTARFIADTQLGITRT